MKKKYSKPEIKHLLPLRPIMVQGSNTINDYKSEEDIFVGDEDEK